MDPSANHENVPSESAQSLWMQEVIRETEHYFQSEIQQDQRASWLLAASGVLIAAWAALEIAILDKGYQASQVLMMASLVGFLLSGGTAILNFIPLYGTRYSKDIFGSKYRHERKMEPSQLLKERLRHDEAWSAGSLDSRLTFHFRSHYLRNLRKAYWVFWSSILLAVGAIIFAISVTGLVVFP